MKCSKARTLILDHVYGELKPRLQRALQKHLQQCSECSKELAAHQATVAAFSKLSIEEPPAELDRRILEHAKEADFRASRSVKATGWYWRPALAAAAVSVLVVTVVYYMPRVRDSRMTMQESPAVTAMKEPAEREEALSAGVKGDAIGGERPRVAAPSALENEVGLMDERRDAAKPSSQIHEEDYREQKLMYAAPSASGEASSIGRISPDVTARESASSPAPELPLAKETFARSAPLQEKDEAQQNIVAGARLQEGLVGMELEKAAGDWDSKQKKAQEQPAKKAVFSEELDCESAAGDYEEALKLEPPSEHAPETLYRLGQCYQLSGEWEKALSVYEQIIQDYADFAAVGEAHLAAGDCLLALGKTSDALHYYETARDSYPAVRDVANEKIEATLMQQEEPAAETQPPETGTE
ncbi:MAG: hypothetical protein C4532_04885 [Candidatus Abyssobacteria bacterium SURF_17]|uniref:Putative zinc-finger domain-containing protein n=1 Tax=Candidatus Abyssobacteria bacterium SURF_17 TaxID=2093361 RepID=A0A419F3S5_9BACT|nr:MAG: hypothetical protein C4532_04885 [Candidatus Abyssubacteria bacterium SURF_17]